MALPNPAFWLIDYRSVKCSIRTVFRIVPYSDRRIPDIVVLSSKNFEIVFLVKQIISQILLKKP